MKIAIFSAQYLPTAGGVERYTDQLAKYAVKAGHEVFIITSALAGLPEEEIRLDGVRIYRLPVWQFMGGRFPLPQPNRKFFRLMHSFWRRQPDAAVIQARFYPLSLYAVRQTNRRKIPTLLIDHSSGHMRPNGWVLTKVGHAYEHFAAHVIKKNCGHIFGVSEQTVRWLGHFGFMCEGILSNAVDIVQIDQILRERKRNYWREKLNLKTGDSIVLYAGRLIPEKGVMQVIHALPLLADRNVHLLIAGEGPLLEEIRQMDGDVIHVLGNIPYYAMMGLFAEADVYCLPTVYAEGFPTTLLEAAACRCPIVTTRTSGVSELILSDRYGKILSNQTPEMIAAGLAEALRCPDWREEAGALLRERVEACFSWEISAKKTLDTLERISQPSV